MSSVSHIYSKYALKHTWFAAGLILADASKMVRSSIPKLLTPMLLREVRASVSSYSQLLRTELANERTGIKALPMALAAYLARPARFMASISAQAVGISGRARFG